MGAPATADVVVIGAGILGSAIAFELARDGRQVTVVDQGSTAGAGSTMDSSAIIRCHYTAPAAVAAARDCYFDWIDWPAYTEYDDPDGTFRYRPTGALVLDPVTENLDQILDRLAAAGIAAERLGPDQVEERFPALDASRLGPPALPEDDAFWSTSTDRLDAVFYADAGYVDLPALAAQNLLSAAARLGARFRRRHKVVDIVTSRARVAGVRLSGGELISTPVVVNAAGPWSDALNVLAGVTGDMAVRGRVLRTETHEIDCPAEFADLRGAFVTDLDLGSAFRPQGSARLHISSTEPECDPLEWMDGADGYSRIPTEEIWTRQVLRVARRLPGLAVPNRPSGVGALYDVTEDWTPIIDKSQLPGFFMACGTSGNSFKLAPLIGRAMRALVAAAEQGRDHDTDPVALPYRHLPGQLDLALYSRLRVPDAAHPRNVLG
ncbi:MAG TPA: FAD-dependent oxidoreductase [Jatrophihabitans sp.]|jgi:glycine/D-amino acid oxidase-like deaminating enzyme|uniref:NAD(P)/FAD-dependent oxidoreductase n=1 Tax=Jatrophihabitans sp. TaxID=1932789 RepID=UPI002EE4FF46